MRPQPPLLARASLGRPCALCGRVSGGVIFPQPKAEHSFALIIGRGLVRSRQRFVRWCLWLLRHHLPEAAFGPVWAILCVPTLLLRHAFAVQIGWKVAAPVQSVWAEPNTVPHEASSACPGVWKEKGPAEAGPTGTRVHCGKRVLGFP